MNEAAEARLLIVDDERAQMQALCDTLQDQGYEVFGCSSAEEALAVLRETPVDLLLADLMMPGMDGITLLREALQLDPTLVGIIMTGEGTITTAVAAMKSGAMDYILKPFRLSAILPVISRGLAMRRLQFDNAVLEQRVREHAAELEAANCELDAFTRTASHDLRTPLTAVLGFASLLVNKTGLHLPAEQRHWLVQIEGAAQDMSRLIDDLMRLSRLGRQALNLQTVDVTALVRGIVDELGQQQPLREVCWHVDELPQTLADASLLRQVFINLLSNAFKFTRHTERATIHIGCELRAKEGVFFVRDNGPGFDMAGADKLFEAFSRLQGADEFEGSGVGLSIVQRIVQRHGGHIWAESLPAQGACFYFTLGGAA